MQIEVVSTDTYSLYMKVKLFNVNIVIRNTQKEVVSRHTSSQYIKEKYFYVNIVNRNSHERVKGMSQQTHKVHT